MRCPSELIWIRYVRGEPAAEEAALLDEHLAVCAACAQFVAAQRALWDALDDPAEKTPWADLEERVAAAIRAEQPSRGPSVLAAHRWLAPMRTAAAVLLAAGLGVAAGVVSSPRPPKTVYALDDSGVLSMLDVDNLLGESATGLQTVVEHVGVDAGYQP
jgi:anti-sigma factor RsiW